MGALGLCCIWSSVHSSGDRSSPSNPAHNDSRRAFWHCTWDYCRLRSCNTCSHHSLFDSPICSTRQGKSQQLTCAQPLAQSSSRALFDTCKLLYVAVFAYARASELGQPGPCCVLAPIPNQSTIRMDKTAFAFIVHLCYSLACLFCLTLAHASCCSGTALDAAPDEEVTSYLSHRQMWTASVTNVSKRPMCVCLHPGAAVGAEQLQVQGD